jgi:Ca2+-binding EF-hand superfamily protein
MKRTLFTSIFSLLFILAVSSLLLAQQTPTQQTPAQKTPMTMPEDTEVEAVFQHADTNADGNISWDEAEKAGKAHMSEEMKGQDKPMSEGGMSKHGGMSMQSHMALFEKETFKEADKNSDNQLSRTEVANYLESNKPMKEPMQGN